MKLLNKTIRSYLFYSFVALLVAIPVFYVVLRSVLLHSVDHSLRAQMHDIRLNLPSIRSAEELQIWSKMDKDIRLFPAEENLPDKIYTIYHKGHRRHDEDPYREIAGTILVNGKLYTLIISNSLVENEDLLGSILLVELFLLLLLLGGMLWINRSTSKNIWKPFYAGLDKMKKYDLTTHRPMQFAKTDIDEFSELNQAIKVLTDRSHDAYERQREFTENAAHEMQTPLAIFQGKIDLLMQTQPLSEEQAKLIGALDETNARLSRLNKSLLLLSKIENNQFFQTESIDLVPLIKDTIEQFRPNADARKIHIHEQFGENLSVNANKTLIEMLVGNLLSNAIRYNLQGGDISIETGDDYLLFTNSGQEETLDPDKIFERFYKSGQHAGSTGLGLSIVKKICDLYGYSIGYQFKERQHQFRISHLRA